MPLTEAEKAKMKAIRDDFAKDGMVKSPEDLIAEKERVKEDQAEVKRLKALWVRT